MTKKGIIWTLFLLIMIFSFVDFIQTKMLLDLGEDEANPLLNIFIELYGITAIIILKLLPYVLLGITMFFFIKREDDKQKKICEKCTNNDYCMCKEKL